MTTPDPDPLRLQRVLFISQHRAEQMRPPRDTALISITDPRSPAARLQPGWAAVLRVSFADADPLSIQGDLDLPGLMGEDEVVDIAAFTAEQARRCRRLVVHCRHGVSRSAAVARAICQATQLPYPESHDRYNRYVFMVLRGAVQYAVEGD
jgi:predicted protein tyrosine phosphatase